MYKLATIKDTVRIPPTRFSEELSDVIIQELEIMLVGRIDKELGVILAVNNVCEVSGGKIILGDGAIYYKIEADILVYTPQINEVIEGSITELTEFGAFVNFGPIDGLIHVSQITEDFMSYDQKNAAFVGRESSKILQVGDLVKARIITVSIKQRISDSKIGLTMRQPYLGKLEWIDEANTKKAIDSVKDEKTPKVAKGSKKEAKK